MAKPAAKNDASSREWNRRAQSLRQLEKHYLTELVEDPQDGTSFDLAILDKFAELREEFGLKQIPDS